jgi:uncharacterized protein YdbL (DUF1318 family)
MNIYKPTWLYIKQHRITGLKYFGKTTQDPYRYKGSGIYWKRHLEKFGNDVSTTWVKLFETQEELTKYALSFSNDKDIVNSKEWANLKPEDGLDGGNMKGVNAGITRSAETKKLLSDINSKPNIERYGIEKASEIARKKSKSTKGKKLTTEHKINLSNARLGIQFSEEHCENISKAKKGKPWSESRRLAQIKK